MRAPFPSDLELSQGITKTVHYYILKVDGEVENIEIMNYDNLNKLDNFGTESVIVQNQCYGYLFYAPISKLCTNFLAEPLRTQSFLSRFSFKVSM